MNCEQGDLAVIIKSLAGNLGVVVKCEKLVESGEESFSFGYPRWKVDKYLPFSSGAPHNTVADSVLAPLRGLNARDSKRLAIQLLKGSDS